MWESARKAVASIFFGDVIELYQDTPEENSLGEELEKLTKLGEYACNIENNSSGVSQQASGTSIPQTIRISAAKSLPVSYSNRYKVKIKSARIAYNATEYWKVDSIVEGQISTVITASRAVSV